MRIFATAAIVLPVALLLGRGTAMANKSDIQPPVAKIEATRLEKHGDVRVDDYYWLRERDNPEVIAYLEAENAYTEAMMARLKPLEDALFAEIKGRIKQTDVSVPYKLGDYLYYYRYEEGKAYTIYCRKRGSLEAGEEVILDVNVLAEGHEHMRVVGRKVSANQQIYAYAADTVGRRIYTTYFKNLETGGLLDDVIPDMTGNMAWGNDDKTFFYTRQDPVTLRSFQVWRHTLGTDVAADVLVYEEKDEEFNCYVWKTKSRKYILIGSFQTLSSEYRFIDADDPTGKAVVFHPREDNLEYDVDHRGDKFYVRTNYDAENFRLMETPVSNTGKKHWRDVIAHRDDVLLESFDVFDNYLVVEERRKGLVELRIRPWDGGEEHYIDFGEPAYTANIGTNLEMKTDKLRYEYSSMTTPESVYDYDMRTREKELRKQEEVLGGFDSADYETDRLYAPARDGVKVPISIVYRKGMVRDGTNPLLLYGYGSYGYSIDASFDAQRLSLLDRGFVYAIAHIRGGQEMGRWWYEDGKLMKKKNTFADFIDCGEYLVSERYTSADRLFATGGSAGGLLIGAILNMRPDLWRGAVTRVPFVDVVTTMLDESIPLTTGEYDEWGNPNEKAAYEYILSYSPYDQVEAKDYPNLLVTTGLHDSQVQYWEPAKWVAKLRAMKSDDNVLLLKTDMEAGHSGGSGRFKKYRETAMKYAWLLDLAGYSEQVPPAP